MKKLGVSEVSNACKNGRLLGVGGGYPGCCRRVFVEHCCMTTGCDMLYVILPALCFYRAHRIATGRTDLGPASKKWLEKICLTILNPKS